MKVPRRAVWIGIAITLTCVLVGIGLVWAVDAHDTSRAERVVGNGTKVVPITLDNVDIIPGRLIVNRGAHVVLDVVNKDSVEHDLAVDGGPRTRMLRPGQAQRLDLGTVTRNLNA